MTHVVTGVVVAAGRSTRMGRAKALLPFGAGGVTFVERLVAVLAQGGVSDVLVVGRPEDDALRTAVERIGVPARFVENRHADEGQVSSVIAGLNVADRPGIGGILVVPVDVPLIQWETVAALVRAFMVGGGPIVRATFEGRHGHPVVFGRAVFADLQRADRAMGAKAVLRAYTDAIVNVEVEDPGVVTDIDEPADYVRAFGREP